ncbi:MAG: protein-glutamate O-methyltransferase CheR [Gammaproteobacteria bacterium]|nr:protein-glutamate O-methyltransferase CheR [Gammaproteobacteria bacterium]
MPQVISGADYAQFSAFLEDASGITLGENKQYLVESRLRPLLEEYRIPTLGHLIERLRRERPPELYARIVDAMTTNETLWFRDGYPFEILRQTILPEYALVHGAPLRLWSAACSSGQEPYSIAMSVEEARRASPAEVPAVVQILATDLSPSMLESARAGRYDSATMARGLDADRRRAFFTEQHGRWELIESVRRRVEFREYNLLASFEPLGKFQVVFFRNVLIYFSPERKREIFTRLATSIVPGGYLFLGASETVAGYTEAFEMQRLSSGIVYRRKRR